MNFSSFTPSSALSDASNAKMTSIPFTTRFRPELELLWVLVSYSPFLYRTFQYASPKIARSRLYPWPPIVVHIFSGPLLVLRYHARYAAQRTWPRPETADLLLFSAFSVSSFLLEAYRSRVPFMTPTIRTGFQAAILLQAVAFGAAWLGGDGAGDPVLFRAVVKFMNWFASFRLTVGLAGFIDPRLEAAGNFAQRYEVAMVSSGCFAVWEAGVPMGVPVFLGLMAVFMLLQRAVAETIWR